MTYTPTNWVDGSTPLNRANMMRIENELALLDGYTLPAPPPTISATPPGSPVDGQLWFVSPVAGTTWQFRYNAGGATYKWEFVGGAPLRTRVDGLSGVNGVSGTWVSFPTLPPITVPRAGEYTVFFGVSCQLATAFASPFDIYIGPVTSGTLYGGRAWFVPQITFDTATLSASAIATLSAAQALTLGIFVSTTTTWNLDGPWLQIEPRRVS